MSSCTVLLELEISDMAAVDVASRLWPVALGPGDPNSHRIPANLTKIITAVNGGTYRGNGWITVLDDSGTAPTATITPTYATMANDWIEWRYGGVPIARLTEGVDFVRGANLAAATVALAAAINAHPILRGLANAGSTATTVPLISTAPEPLGSSVTMATNDAAAFAFVQMAGGVAGAPKLALTYLNLGAAP